MADKKRHRDEEVEAKETQETAEQAAENEEAGDEAAVLENETANEAGADEALDQCREALKACEDKYLRMHAEFENIKKRMEREKEKSVAYAQEAFAKDLLPIIDALELAIASIPSESDDEHLNKLREGVQLTLDNFFKTFEKHHIKVIEIDSGFDPNFHDAVMQVDSDEHESGEIVQVLQKGYTYKERLLRPAMVSVAK